MKPILQVEHLTKHFTQTPVLNDISFNVMQGEFIAIMGPSGSGKSTLLYNISGMDKPSSGHVYLQEKDISLCQDKEMSNIRLTQLGFVFQHPYLLKHLTIKDNIMLPGLKANKQTHDQIKARADQLMTKTKITHNADQDITQVSGGELQRASICRAIINQPAILFGDEPTGALNSSTTKEIMDIINTIHAEQTTIILVTHDMKVAARASRIIYLMDGVIQNELLLDDYHVHQEDVEEERQKREKTVAEWLDKQGF